MRSTACISGESVGPDPSTLAVVVLVLVAYACWSLSKGRRIVVTGALEEYFAVMATSIFLPLEVHDLVPKG